MTTIMKVWTDPVKPTIITVKEGFDAKEEAKELRKAMKGLGE